MVRREFDIPQELPPTVELNKLPEPYRNDWVLGIITAYNMEYPTKPTHIAVIGHSNEDLDAIGQAVLFQDGLTFPTLMLKEGKTWFIADNENV